jgi:alanyl aminopeptidase
MNHRSIFGLVALSACAGGKAAPTAPPAPPPVADVAHVDPPAPPPTPPELRLPTTVRPTRNTVELAIDPTSEDFTGTITSDLAIAAPTRVVWLNGTEIAIDRAALTVGGDKLAAVATYPKPGYIALALPHEVPAGTATLAIAYRGKMHAGSGDGIYTAKEAGDAYAFTQFEATDARRAFPTFDEPSFKVPWRLSIRTKHDLAVFSNTPVESESDAGNGQKLVRFVETRPLPSYLVAFAVGPFDTVPAGTTRAGAPIRIVVPRGRGGDAAYPAKATAPLLALLEDYFGTPYPFGKLDIVAVSVFNAGAMENPGLITFRQELVLTKPAEMTLDHEKTYAAVAGHEMAHQWFGDDVTLAWWDDTWLNEAFATWMETKVVAKWKPEWDADVEVVAGKSYAMREDSLDSARAVRQPIESANDIKNAFDGITYEKGEAVLTMIEHSIGEATFQRGVRTYLAKHSGGNATYDDFVSAMSTAAGRDLRPLFDSFVLRSGVPLVGFELQCAKGAAPKLALDQRRYAPIGSEIDPKRTWTMPVCVRWGAGAASGSDCGVLDGERGELALSAKQCPDWVLPNAGEVGYYRMLPKGELLTKLLAHMKSLTLAERIGVIGDVEALVTSGDVPNGVALGLVAEQAKDKSRHVVRASVRIVGGIDDLVPDALRPNYERFVRKIYSARAKELGWQPKPGESSDAKELRPTLLSLVASGGHDKELIAQASALAWKWLDDHGAVAPDLVGTVLRVAAHFGDQKLFDRLHAETKKTTDRQERGRYLSAMGAFRDPAIVDQALALAITDEIDLREGSALLNGAFADPRTREHAWQFVKQHYDEIAKKLPEAYRPYMAMTAVPLCDASRKAEVEAFLKPKIDPLDGGPRMLAQALEQMALCSANRNARAPGIAAFLKKQ